MRRIKTFGQGRLMLKRLFTFLLLFVMLCGSAVVLASTDLTAPQASRQMIVPHFSPTTRAVKMEVTAYCACRKCCGKHARGITASGKHVSYNGGAFVAADTDLLPFGTKIVIPGYRGELPVEVIDTGSAIKGKRLDVFFTSHEEALKWGRQKLSVGVVVD